MNRGEIARYARMLMDELGVLYVVDTDSSRFTLTDSIVRAYQKVGRELKAFPVGYSMQAVPGVGTYNYSAFGRVFADTDAIAAAASAAGAPAAMVQVGGQPAGLTTDKFKISVSLIGAAGPLAVTPSVYTILGVSPTGEPITETLTFTLADGPLGAAQLATKNGVRYFGEVLSVTPSIAQVATMTHSAGVVADSPGDRIFELSFIAYDQVTLLPVTPATMENSDRSGLGVTGTGAGVGWRFTAAGTPSYWLPWGERQFRVTPPPAATVSGVLSLQSAAGTTDLTMLAATAALLPASGIVLVNGTDLVGYTSKTATTVTECSNHPLFPISTPIEAGGNLYLEGWETPDPAMFALDTDIPALHEDDHELIAVWAAILHTIRDPSADNQGRANALWTRFQEGLRAARERIHRGRGRTVVGRFAHGLHPVNHQFGVV